jgi:hypothetical protein
VVRYYHMNFGIVGRCWWHLPFRRQYRYATDNPPRINLTGWHLKTGTRCLCIDLTYFLVSRGTPKCV